MDISIPHNWLPRPYQLAAWRAWETGAKRLLLIWHRRAGKDELGLHIAAVAAHKRIANYWHCLPEYEQARKAIWEAINPHSGVRRIDEAFPVELRKRTDNSSMTIEFASGSIWKVVGSDNPDSLVGAPPAGIVFSEWALSNPAAWAYLAPILAENGGWAAFITTPRGRNHAHAMLEFRGNPDWFVEVLTPRETGFPLGLVEEQRREYHSIFGQDAGDALIEQEYWCSFEAAILGAYWGKEMVAAEREGRIGNVPVEPDLLVHTAWDLGIGDAMAIWFWQVVGPEIRIVDFYEAHGHGMRHYTDLIEAKGYRQGTDYVPHDARARMLDEEGRTRVQVLMALGRKPKLVIDHKLMDGIHAARQTLPRCHFDAERCKDGLERLRQYRAEWDDDKKCFRDTPAHDWTSHASDAFRYLAMAWRELAAKPAPRPAPRTIHEMTLNELWDAERNRRDTIRI